VDAAARRLAAHARRRDRIGAAPPAPSIEGLVVVDLSALWAGPLCANVLGLAGARVIKVESRT